MGRNAYEVTLCGLNMAISSKALAAPPAILALHCSALKELLAFEVRRPLVPRCVHALAEILAHVSLEDRVFALVARQRTACLIARVECIPEVAERMPWAGGIGVALGCSIYSATRFTRLLGLLGYSATRLLGYSATRLLGYSATRLLGYSATRLLGYSATRFTRLLGPTRGEFWTTRAEPDQSRRNDYNPRNG